MTLKSLNFEEYPGALIEGNQIILFTEDQKCECRRLDKSGYQNVFIHKDPEGYLVFIGEKINFYSISPSEAQEITKAEAKQKVCELGRDSVTIKAKRHPLLFWKKVIKFYLNSGWYRLESTGPYTIMMSSYQIIKD